MAHLLLVGGPLDRQVRNLPADWLVREYIRIPEPPDLSMLDWRIADVPAEPVSFRVLDYKLFRVGVRNDYDHTQCGQVRFAYHVSITALEALVMVFQHYQEGPVR